MFGHGALMAVTHMFPEKVLLLPEADWSQMSTPPSVGRLLACWMGGFPAAMFPRTRLLVAPANTTMPFVLPLAVLASTRLLLPERRPIPKVTTGPVEYPFPLVSFHRSELLLPWIHMPPQVVTVLPFLTDTFPSTLMSEEAGPI